MKEEIIKFETAKLAKEKGFDLECLNFYIKPNSKMYGIDEHERSYPIQTSTKNDVYIVGEQATLHFKNVLFAPTQSLLQKWLREMHNITIQIIPEGFDENTAKTNWCYLISKLADQDIQEQYLKKELGQDGDLLLQSEPINGNTWYLTESKTYEQALEKGLQQALKLI